MHPHHARRSLEAHPINFFEQSTRCEFCGCERFSTTTPSKCCQGGKLLLNSEPTLPEPLLRLMQGRAGSATAQARGISKTSRSLNGQFRFAVQRLPWINGERQAPMQDAYQHLRITGVPCEPCEERT